MKDLPQNLKEGLIAWTKIIAVNVRNKMEDFHIKYLSDEQMKELNPIIRQAIYEVLRQFYFLKKGSQEQQHIALVKILGRLAMIPDYWEDPELTEEDLAREAKLAEINLIEQMEKSGSRYAPQALMDFGNKHMKIFD